MATIQTFNLTLYGQVVTGISIPIGSTVQFNLTCQDPSTRSPIVLSSIAVVMAVSALDSRGNPTQPAIISRQATITNAGSGLCYVPWASGDTVPGGIPVLPGKYWFEVWIEDTGGNRLQDMAGGYVQLTPVGRLPNQLVTPLPGQNPIAYGGMAVTPVKIAAYTAAFQDLVRCNPTGGAFTVTLPAASGSGRPVFVKNVANTSTTNAVTVAPAGADTIDFGGSAAIYAGESLMLFSDGVSNWMVFA